ncbi:uncharacterized protein ACRADG_010200 isoform 2-T2 [Cochliomyia hominivorax]
MDKTLRFFSSGQTKNVSSLPSSNNTDNKDLAVGQTNGFIRDSNVNHGKHIQNHTGDMKRKDSDNFFYILWHS